MPLVADAAKVLLYKQVDSSVRGRIANAPVDPRIVTDRDGQIIADYDLMVLVEIDEARLTDLTTATEAADLQWEVRRDYEEVAINGYRFPSGSSPDLPDNLSSGGFEEAVGFGTKGERRTLIARLTAEEMIAVANRPDVLWIERAPREVPTGERSNLIVAEAALRRDRGRHGVPDQHRPVQRGPRAASDPSSDALVCGWRACGYGGADA